MMNTQNKKGFTLIELLIVIGILAVLATLTVLVLNPAELFRQARDSQRVSDLDSLRDAINYVQGTATTVPTMTNCATNTGCTTGTTTTCSTSPLNIYANACTTVTGRANTGTASNWVGFDFTAAGTISPAPISILPIDPVTTAGVNGGTYFYTWKSVPASGTYKLGAVLESAKYAGQMTADGGTATGMYEIGTVLTAI